MELFAAGFNAWNQLSFEPPLVEDQEPHDLHTFTKVLEAPRLERPVARLSYTIVQRDGRLCMAGLGPESSEELEFLYSSAEAANGEILTIPNSPSSPSSNVLLKYPRPSLAAWKSGTNMPRPWLCSNPPAKQLAAFDTGFVILYADGSVATLGDARFESSLGRDITAEQPADAPGPVPDLHDINDNDPVQHVTAGGHSVAALTASGSIYVWGTASPGTAHRRRQALQALISGVPEYTEVDGGKDVADVALGDSHAVALTTDGCVYVVGEDNNGQLGLGKEFGERVEEWTRVPFEVAVGCEIVGVAAGPKSSFILTSKMEKTQGSGDSHKGTVKGN